jgi:hypothetical protein
VEAGAVRPEALDLTALAKLGSFLTRTFAPASLSGHPVPRHLTRRKRTYARDNTRTWCDNWKQPKCHGHFSRPLSKCVAVPSYKGPLIPPQRGETEE